MCTHTHTYIKLLCVHTQSKVTKGEEFFMLSFNSWCVVNREINYSAKLEICLGSISGKKIKPFQVLQFCSIREDLLYVSFS